MTKFKTSTTACLSGYDSSISVTVAMSHSAPAGADHRLFWNGQYLLEDDPDDPANYSKAAEEAQRAVSILLWRPHRPH